MFIAIPAPTPTVLPVAPPPVGSALALEVVLLSAASLTAPAPVTVIADPVARRAVACVSIRFSANDPARPTFVAPAPDVATVVKAFPPKGLRADSDALAALTALVITASFTTFAMLIPRATPTPVAEATAEPSAMTLALFALLVKTSTAPEAFVVAVELIRALVVEVRSEMAIAPATETPPSPVFACPPYLLSVR